MVSARLKTLVQTRLSGALCIAAALLCLSFAPAFAQKRVALVVGNSNYQSAGLTLVNPRNDAEDVARTLRALGFEVVQSIDSGRREMEVALQSFSRLASGADSALFFYAGHAMQYQGRNYLMPTDAKLEDEISLRYEMVSLDDVRAALGEATGIRIMILDACRNNPLADRLLQVANGRTRNAAPTRGLARVDKAQGSVVAYATAADDVAVDGRGRNSPFTAALVKRMQEPGLEIEMMFRRIAADVNADTAGRQRPETYVSLLSEYYLNQNDALAWERVKDSGDPAALRDFVARFPSSTHALMAKYRLELLERYARERQDSAAAAAAAAAAPPPRIEGEAAQGAERQKAEAERRQAEIERERIAAREQARREADQQKPQVRPSSTAVADTDLPPAREPRSNARKRSPAQCREIVERAQVGELTAEDRMALRSDCR